jgi:hypothetical protein
MRLRTTLAGVAIACLISRGLLGQAAGVNPVVWRGTSLCLVRPSACHDEIVVYRISRAPSGDTLLIDARKIVTRKELEMGLIGCRFDAVRSQLTCTMPNGTWRFALRADSLVGDLKLPDGTKFRDVRTVRSR